MPAWRYEAQFDSPENATGVVPDSTPLTVSPPPRNGTRTMSAPVSFLKFSMNTQSGSPGAM